MTRIRRMVAADAPRVADLTTQLGYPTTPEETASRFAAIEGRDDNVVLVATDEADAVIGWIQVVRLAAMAESEMAQIGGFVIDDAHRSAGIGAELLAAGEAWAREHGARTMSVRSRTERGGAHRFYEAHEYRQIKLSHVFHKPLG